MSDMPHKMAVMGLSTLSVAACGLVWTAGCNGPVDRASSVQEVPILRRLAGSSASLREPIRVVARDWETYCQLGLPDLPVEWGREMVLVAALGPTLRRDLTLFVDRVEQRGSAIHPSVRLALVRPPEPAENNPWKQARCPFEVVVVPYSGLNVIGFTTEPPERARPRGGVRLPLSGGW